MIIHLTDTDRLIITVDFYSCGYVPLTLKPGNLDAIPSSWKLLFFLVVVENSEKGIL